MLRSPKALLQLEPTSVEDLCLASSQEFYDNAGSGNYHFGDMKLAYDWFVLYLCVISTPITNLLALAWMYLLRQNEFYEKRTS